MGENNKGKKKSRRMKERKETTLLTGEPRGQGVALAPGPLEFPPSLTRPPFHPFPAQLPWEAGQPLSMGQEGGAELGGGCKAQL